MRFEIVYSGAREAGRGYRVVFCERLRCVSAGEVLVQGEGSRGWGVWFEIWGLGFRVQGLGCRVSGFRFRVSGFGFRGSGFRFRVFEF